MLKNDNVREIKKNLRSDPVLKWEIVKKVCRKYKEGDIYWQLCIEEKLAIGSYNNPKELLNQRSEILDICRHKRVGYLVGKIWYLFLLSFFLFYANF